LAQENEGTNIWHTNWLPRDEGLLRPVQSIKPNAPQLVSELIDHTMAMWDVNKLQEFFITADIEVIQSIPLALYSATRRLFGPGIMTARDCS
jgi:hypothetical protein